MTEIFVHVKFVGFLPSASLDFESLVVLTFITQINHKILFFLRANSVCLSVFTYLTFWFCASWVAYCSQIWKNISRSPIYCMIMLYDYSPICTVLSLFLETTRRSTEYIYDQVSKWVISVCAFLPGLSIYFRHHHL